MKRRIDRMSELNALQDRRVMVYRNLHYKDEVTWSGKSMKLGQVMFHLPVVLMQDCKFKVSQKGRERVLRERKKNVHAGVVGTLCPFTVEVWSDPWVRVKYNPYTGPTFIRADNGEPIFEARKVLIDETGVRVLV